MTARTEAGQFVPVLDHLKEGILLLDESGRVRYLNPALRAQTGLGTRALIGQALTTVQECARDFPPLDRLTALLDAAITTQSGLFEIHRRVELAAYPLQEPHGVVGVLRTTWGVERGVGVYEPPRRLRQAIDELNTALIAIAGHAELAQMDLAPGGNAQASVHEIARSCEQALAAVRQLTGTTLPVPPGGAKVDDVVLEVLELLRPTLPAGVDVAMECHVNGLAVRATPSQLFQVVMNTCTNACDAMRGREGAIRICVDAVERWARADGPGPGGPPQPFARITITDPGPGVAPKCLNRIFDPRYTTRPGGRSGLGLSIVREVVLELDGSVSVCSASGNGLQLAVELPITGQPQGVAPAPGCTTGARIMLVDDEPMLLQVVERLINRLGHDVRVFNKGEDALAVFEADPTQFDLLIMDQTMPGMSGLELAQRVRAVSSGVPIIIATGLSHEVFDAEVADHLVTAVLEKPVTLNDLHEVIDRVLGRSGNRTP